MKALGVAISAQNHLYLAGPSLVKYWGAARAGITTPVKMYLDAQLPVSSGTDAPVVPYPPLWTLYHFVTRDTITGGVLGADQRVYAPAGAAHGDDQQRVADDGRADEGIDRAGQVRGPRRSSTRIRSPAPSRACATPRS